MKTGKQKLSENPIDYHNSDGDLLETFYFAKLQNFAMYFNAKLYTYKTYGGFINKRNYFISKYNLTEI